MNRLNLQAKERNILGKKVKKLRRDGLIPGHVFGKNIKTEHVSVPYENFIKIFHQAGETGLIDLKIGEEEIRPVLIRDIQKGSVKGDLLHIDFYQVNLKEKVRVPVPIVRVGEEPESIHLGEAVILQPISEVEVEALPTDLVEKIEVDITPLKNIDDIITIEQLKYDREKLTINADPDEVVVKLAPAVTEEMQQLLEEQEAEAAAAAEVEGIVPAEGEVEGEEKAPEGETTAEEPTKGGEEVQTEGEVKE